MSIGSSDNRSFRWGLWALIGCAGWIALMLVLGAPIALLVTPALGPITGWLVGGILHRARRLVSR